MASFFDKIFLKSAAQNGRNKFDLSCETITTQDFFKPKPVYVREMIPDETINIKASLFTRLDPLQHPFYGNVRIKNRAFFVPYRTVMEGFTNFISKKPYTYSNADSPSIISSPCYFSNNDLVSFFVDYGLTDNLHNGYFGTIPQLVEPVEDGEFFDFKTSAYFVSDDYTGTNYKFNFTNAGRLFYDILLSLGYVVDFNPDISADPSTGQMRDSVFSALPLLSYVRVWFDWLATTQYANLENVSKFFTGQSRRLTSEDLGNLLFALTLVPRESDYFSSAWDKPVGPNGSSNFSPDIIFNDMSSYAGDQSKVVTSSVGTPIIHGNVGGTPGQEVTQVTSLSQYVLDALKRVTDYMKRQQLSGFRALDGYASEYGIYLNSEQLQRSSYVGKFDSYLQISDVMQTSPDITSGTSDTSGLGDYVGKGLSSSNGRFKFTTKEFGLFIIISYVEPAYSNFYGRSRHIFHFSALDFFKGAFDNLGVQAIRQDEWAVKEGSRYHNGVFGYVPRYSEYKVSRDLLSGDFRFWSRAHNLKGWYLQNPVSNPSSMSFESTHNIDVVLGHSDEHADLFISNDNSFDHFYSIFHFDVEVYAPMKLYFDTYDFAEGGKTVEMNVNGNRVQ